MSQRALWAGLMVVCVPVVHAEEIALYPSGPSEDSAFLRFINAAPAPLKLKAAGGASLTLSSEQGASDFMTVPANKPVKGQLQQAGHEQALDISVAPGEFATVAALEQGQSIRYVSVRELPDDFNALKASLGFYNLDAGCEQAGLQVAGRHVDIFNAQTYAQVQRRSINPVQLSVQLNCAGHVQGEPMALGQLEAGQRYSVFVVPSPQGPRLLKALDNLAN